MGRLGCGRRAFSFACIDPSATSTSRLSAQCAPYDGLGKFQRGPCSIRSPSYGKKGGQGIVTNRPSRAGTRVGSPRTLRLRKEPRAERPGALCVFVPRRGPLLYEVGEGVASTSRTHRPDCLSRCRGRSRPRRSWPPWPRMLHRTSCRGRRPSSAPWALPS